VPTFVELPDCIFDRKHWTEHVDKLNCSLYGLKQAPKIWNATLSHKIKEIGYDMAEMDLCIFYKNVEGLEYIGVYVNDMVLVAKTSDKAQMIVDKLKTQFELTELGSLKNIIGWEIKENDRVFMLNKSCI
jgi:Reverse transcriptase (RNA-dependent DNA polymerase)